MHASKAAFGPLFCLRLIYVKDTGLHLGLPHVFDAGRMPANLLSPTLHDFLT
jgi:hypothetical protein